MVLTNHGIRWTEWIFIILRQWTLTYSLHFFSLDSRCSGFALLIWIFNNKKRVSQFNDINMRGEFANTYVYCFSFFFSLSFLAFLFIDFSFLSSFPIFNVLWFFMSVDCKFETLCMPHSIYTFSSYSKKTERNHKKKRPYINERMKIPANNNCNRWYKKKRYGRKKKRTFLLPLTI
jgi:hypothetical protein